MYMFKYSIFHSVICYVYVVSVVMLYHVLSLGSGATPNRPTLLERYPTINRPSIPVPDNIAMVT